MGAIGGSRTGIQESPDVAEGDDILRIVQQVRVDFGHRENCRRVLAEVPQQLRDTEKRPGAHRAVAYRGNLRGNIWGQ
jgi:hypothetical protein